MEKYSLEKAQDEAFEIQKKAREIVERRDEQAEPNSSDYDNAEAIFDERKNVSETDAEIKITKSVFNEKIYNDSRVEIDEAGKNKLLDEIKLIASKLENLIKLANDEELVFKIDFLAPMSAEQLEYLKTEKAPTEAGEEASRNANSKDLEKEFGPEFGGDFHLLSRAQRWAKLKERYIEKILHDSRSDIVLRANVTITRKKKKDGAGPYYANINLFGDEIVQKHKGEISLDDLVMDIVLKLEK